MRRPARWSGSSGPGDRRIPQGHPQRPHQARISILEALGSGVAITVTGSPLPTATLEASLECDAVLLGAVGDNKFNDLTPDKRPEAGLLQIRQALGGYANLRPSIAYPALAENSPLRPEVTKDANILFVRELLGGLYFGSPRWWDKETGESINRSEEHTSELQSRQSLVCRLLLEK